MEKELEHPLWSCSGDRRSFKIKSGVVLCERDMPGSSVPEVNPAGFTKSSEAQRWGGNFYSVSSKLLSSLTAGGEHRINHQEWHTQ